jgi:hypothetical protein
MGRNKNGGKATPGFPTKKSKKNALSPQKLLTKGGKQPKVSARVNDGASTSTTNLVSPATTRAKQKKKTIPAITITSNTPSRNPILQTAGGKAGKLVGGEIVTDSEAENTRSSSNDEEEEEDDISDIASSSSEERDTDSEEESEPAKSGSKRRKSSSSRKAAKRRRKKDSDDSMRIFAKMMSQMSRVAKSEADKRSVEQMSVIQKMISKEVGKKPTVEPVAPVEDSITTEAKDKAAAGMAISHPMAYLTGDAPLSRKDRDQGNFRRILFFSSRS